MKKFALFFVACVIVGAGVGVCFEMNKKRPVGPVSFPAPVVVPVSEPDAVSAPAPVPAPAFVPVDALLDVPFTSQAPTGEWGNDIFQSGCEEASLVMALRWARTPLGQMPKKLTSQEAREALVALAEFQRAQYGYSQDTDVADTVKLAREYFHVDAAHAAYNISKQDIIRELDAGHVVIVPANGRLLHNPNFTAPGPLEHALVIKGYDVVHRQFITNDPGTRKGESYLYDEDVLFGAIREYPSGMHRAIGDEARKSMIVVERVGK